VGIGAVFSFRAVEIMTVAEEIVAEAIRREDATTRAIMTRVVVLDFVREERVMACGTCGHTVQKVTDGIFWCPRCGSLLEAFLEHTKVEAPKLVERCREFGERVDEYWLKTWQHLGIAEAINLPESRPQ
jgi:Zn finger protein HypA/HybF involved in hydrogenase expression